MITPKITTLILGSIFLIHNVMCYPFHASCEINWTWGKPCSDIQTAIVGQIQAWSGNDCGSGEKCMYKLISNTGNTVKAIHTTPVKHYVDDLTFVFTSGVNGTSCQVNGSSRSEIWYAVLDYGTNYCNLHNLITGAGLDKVAEYSESTSDAVCTQFSSANCDKY